MVRLPGISKSRFTRYVECPKLGYMQCYPKRFKHLADPPDWMTQHLMDEGVRVGALARRYFPGGLLIGHTWDLDRACAETTAALRDETVTYVFEAAVAAEGLLCRVDVLRRVCDGQVDIIEVKATNGVRSDHLADVGFQTAVLEQAGLTVRSINLMHFDPGYVYPGDAGRGDVRGCDAAAASDYDLESLFVIDDVTDDARRWMAEALPRHLESMCTDLAGAEPPRVPLHYACRDCCYYRQVCGPAGPDHPVYELGGDRGGLFAALHAAGIVDLREIPGDFAGLTEGHQLVLEAVCTGELALDRGKLRDMLGELRPPLWFIDFETFMPGLPVYPGTRPWQQVPFQWSLHVLDEHGVLKHEEFLCAEARDPRRAFAESLLQAVGPSGSIVVYNKGMESTRLEELARDFPELAGGLSSLNARVFDLLPVVRQCCYHIDFHGSRSLKSVTPILAPHLSYEGLGLRGGLQAMEAYARAVDPTTSEAERHQLCADLREYCGVDTLAMVEIIRRFWDETAAA
ncbi:MAG: DUF2779 domain-containing protein [Thermoleophilia bacterium]|nr:DUF2779 domain-containing protein [Thermoleophilia bacterium]